MNTTKYLIAATLVGMAAWNSTAPLMATTGQEPAEQSEAWLEAKSAFTPVNELRESSEQTAASMTDGTTMRLLGLGSGQDLTVFPPLSDKRAEADATAQTQEAASDTESQVVDVAINPTKVSEQKTIWRQPETAAESSRDSELVLLPSVESVGLSSTFLASSQSNDRIAYASRAFAADNAIEQASQAEGQYIQEEGAAQWGTPVVGGGCCDSCCSTGCKRCCRPAIIVVSTEAVFLSPTANGVPAFFQFDSTGAVTDTLQFGPTYDTGTLDNFYAAPRISAGWQGPCWGVIGRYYHMRAAEHAHDPFVPAGQFANHSFDMNNILEAYYTDIELTRNFCLHGCKSQFAFGCRYALISHDESIYGRSSAAGGSALLQGGARRNREAHGTGLTMGINGRKPLFCNSCAHWFFSARTSVLWGPNLSEVESWADVTVGAPATVGAAGTIDGASVAVSDDLFIGEVQVGIEWDFALRCLPAKAFFRTAFEYQYWDGSTGSTDSGSFAGAVNGGDNYQVTTGSWAPGLIVDFVGLSVGTGFTW